MKIDKATAFDEITMVMKSGEEGELVALASNEVDSIKAQVAGFIPKDVQIIIDPACPKNNVYLMNKDTWERNREMADKFNNAFST